MAVTRAKRTVTPPLLKIEKGATSYVIPYFWSMADGGSAEFNAKLQDRAFYHGGEKIGDGFAKGRSVTVELFIKEASRANYTAAVETLYQNFYQEDYKLYAGETDRFYKVAGISKIKQKYEKGLIGTAGTVAFTLLLAEPFLYSTLQTVETDTLANNGTLEIENTGNVSAPAVITFTPGASGAPSIKLINETTGKEFEIADTLLISGVTMTVDAEKGTVRRAGGQNAGNAINTFSGLFLDIIPGENTLKYTGNSCGVSVAMTPRWFA